MDFTRVELRLISRALLGQSLRSNEFAQLQRTAGFDDSADRMERMGNQMYDLFRRVHNELSVYEHHIDPGRIED